MNIYQSKHNGLISTLSASVPSTFNELIHQGSIPGIATLAALNGEVIYQGCYGWLNQEVGSPVKPDSIFRIFSLTKPVIAAAVLMLMERGRLALDQPVSYWLPGFKKMRVYELEKPEGIQTVPLQYDITIWNLLTHTSGLANTINPSTPVERTYAAAGMYNDMVQLQIPFPEFITRLTRQALESQPGTVWKYSCSYDVLGYLIQLIADIPLDAFLKENIFHPLGMVDTDFSIPQAKLSRLGPLYERLETGEQKIIDPLQNSFFTHPPVAPSGGAGLVSTITDTWRFFQMLANVGKFENVQLLKPETIHQMIANQLTGSQYPVRFGNPVRGLGYGLGVGIQVEDDSEDGMPAGAFGWIGLSGCSAYIYPVEQMVIISIPQIWGDFSATNLFRRMVYRAYLSVNKYM